jgi:hypothetical protein
MAMDVGGMMGSSGAAFPPISNYKGVMLCDRPSADVGKSNRPAPFNSAVVPPEQLGLAPPKRVNVQSVQHKEKDTGSVMYKHKQYLANLKREIKAQKEAEDVAAQDEEAKRVRFVERSANLRDAIRAGLLAAGAVGEGAAAEATRVEAAEAEAVAAAQEATAVEEVAEPQLAAPKVPALKLPGSGDHPGTELLNKPAWALTESQAGEKDELQEEVDLDELLDFVEDLDFEQYVDDLEVQQALEIMRSRVTHIETQRSERGAEEGGEPREVVVLRPDDGGQTAGEEGWDGSVAGEEEDGDATARSEAIKAAKELLGSSRKLRAVHSTASIAKRLEALQEEQEAAEAEEAAAAAQGQKKDVDPSNLPYLYRNPAV